jgi:hypothetical protein
VGQRPIREDVSPAVGDVEVKRRLVVVGDLPVLPPFAAR